MWSYAFDQSVYPAALHSLGLDLGERVEVGLREVVDLAVLVEAEELERHRLVAHHRHTGEVERQLAGDATLLELAHVLARRVVQREQPRRRRAIGERAIQLALVGQLREPRRIAGVLERDRGDVARVRIGDERAHQIAAAERVDHRGRQIGRTDLFEELLGRLEVRLRQALVALVLQLAVLLDDLGIEARGDRIRAFAGNDPVVELGVLDEIDAVGAGTGRSAEQGRTHHREKQKPHVPSRHI